MAIVCINLSDTALPMTESDFEKYQLPVNISTFAAGIARAIVFNSACRIPQKVVEAITEVWDGYTPGQCGMHRITSAWVKEKHPNAKFEIVFTLVSEDRNEVHVLLIYLP